MCSIHRAFVDRLMSKRLWPYRSSALKPCIVWLVAHASEYSVQF